VLVLFFSLVFVFVLVLFFSLVLVFVPVLFFSLVEGLDLLLDAEGITA
jgi:hypothetical protein